MNLIKTNLSIQLKLGFLVIGFCMASIGALAQYQTYKIWRESDDIYLHPFMVRSAISQFMLDISGMNLDIKDIVLAETPQERSRLVLDVDALEADAYLQLSIVQNAYLGPRSDVDRVRDSFSDWKTIRNQALQLGLDGKIDEAAHLAAPGGQGSIQFNKIMSDSLVISRYANIKGQSFHDEAKRVYDSFQLQMDISLGITIFLTLGIVYIALIQIGHRNIEHTELLRRYKEVLAQHLGAP